MLIQDRITIISQNLGNGDFQPKSFLLSLEAAARDVDVILLQEPGVKQENLLFELDNRLKSRYHVFSKLLNREERLSKWRQRKCIKILKEGKSIDINDQFSKSFKEDSRTSEGVITLIRKSWMDKCTILKVKSKRILSIALKLSDKEVVILNNFYAPSGNKSKNDKFFTKMKLPK